MEFAIRHHPKFLSCKTEMTFKMLRSYLKKLYTIYGNETNPNRKKQNPTSYVFFLKVSVMVLIFATKEHNENSYTNSEKTNRVIM